MKLPDVIITIVVVVGIVLVFEAIVSVSEEPVNYVYTKGTSCEFLENQVVVVTSYKQVSMEMDYNVQVQFPDGTKHGVPYSALACKP
jgi:hypothetical protein